MTHAPMISLLALSLAAQEPAPTVRTPLLPPEGQDVLPLDRKDHLPVLLGPASRASILAHREIFRTGTGKAALPAAWRDRWKAVAVPCTLVVAFGSWCGDTQRELPDVLALAADPNPFIQVHFLGVDRSKVAPSTWWPEGIPAPAVEKVPTVWLFEQQPGGGQRLVGSIVENPPKAGQRMAEAVLELLERIGP